MPKVWISLGSNQNREYNLQGAIKALRQHYGNVLLSSVYEGTAIGFDGAPFYNLVAGFQTIESPHKIVQVLHSIEDSYGRVRTNNKFTSRSLDLDLLTWGELILHEKGLILPREEILIYAFVLRPLSEIAGLEQHPVLKQTYQELWSKFDAASQLLREVYLKF
ncbi:hypothetical protein TI05_02335 [Achromatium sp. WMS3]|nr:hypothetical protein TI05_02335 [Achromatium sp. WMS3]